MAAPRRTRASVPPELRVSAVAAAALIATLVLPWYQKSYFATSGRRPVAVSDSMSAFGAFSFVEAAVLVVAAGVLYLVWARAHRRAFHLPGGDGTVIMVAGGWAALLIVWRLFDTPNVNDPGATVGIQWGIFVALVAAVALAVSGARVRAADRPEPPNPVAEDDDWQAAPSRRERPPARRPVGAQAVTEALTDRPSWEGEPPDEDPARRARRAQRAAARRGEEPPAPRDDAPEPPDTERLF